MGCLPESAPNSGAKARRASMILSVLMVIAPPSRFPLDWRLTLIA